MKRINAPTHRYRTVTSHLYQTGLPESLHHGRLSRHGAPGRRVGRRTRGGDVARTAVLHGCAVRHGSGQQCRLAGTGRCVGGVPPPWHHGGHGTVRRQDDGAARGRRRRPGLGGAGGGAGWRGDYGGIAPPPGPVHAQPVMTTAHASRGYISPVTVIPAHEAAGSATAVSTADVARLYRSAASARPDSDACAGYARSWLWWQEAETRCRSYWIEADGRGRHDAFAGQLRDTSR